jgi:hypothetical protein
LVVGGFELGELAGESLVILVSVLYEFLDSGKMGEKFSKGFGEIVFVESFFPVNEAREVVEVSFNCFFLLVSGSLFKEESEGFLCREWVFWINGRILGDNRAFVVRGGDWSGLF